MENILIVLPLIFAALYIGLFVVGAIIGVTTLGFKKHGNLTGGHSNHVNSVKI